MSEKIDLRVGDMVTIEGIPDSWSFGQMLRGRPGARGRIEQIGPMPGLWPDGAPLGVLATWTPDDGGARYEGWVGAEQVKRGLMPCPAGEIPGVTWDPPW